METVVSTFLVLTLQLSALSYGSTAGVHSVQRRGVALLCYQMEKAINSSCMQYLGYGCFCGLGGRGNPVDDVDRCCQAHDQCYGDAKCKHGWYDYFVHYGVKCSGGQCNCTDNESTSPCAYTICECDRVFAECIRTTRHLMNPVYKQYSKKKC